MDDGTTQEAMLKQNMEIVRNQRTQQFGVNAVAELEMRETEEFNQAMTEEKTALEMHIQELQKAELVLAAKIESLDYFAKEHLSPKKAHFDQVEKAQYIADGFEPALNLNENIPNHQAAEDADGKLSFEKSLAVESVKAKVSEVEEQLEQLHILEDKARDEKRPTVNDLQADVEEFRGNRELASLFERQISVLVQAKVSEVEELLEQLHSMEDKARDQNRPINDLQAAVEEFRELLSESREKMNASQLEITAIKGQLHEAQNSAQQHQNEAEHLREKVRSLAEELRNLANVERSAAPSEDKETLQDECEALRFRLRKAEDDASKYVWCSR